MKVGELIKDYFRRTPVDEWDYKSFKSFIRILKYDDEDSINKNHVRILKETVNNENIDNNKKEMANKLLKELGFKENILVRLIFIIISCLYTCIYNDKISSEISNNCNSDKRSLSFVYEIYFLKFIIINSNHFFFDILF